MTTRAGRAVPAAGRTSRICQLTGVVLLLAKLGAVVLEPETQPARVFPHLCVALVALLLLRGGPRRRGLRGGLLLVGGVMIGFIALMAWVDHDLAGRHHAGVVDDPHKVWAARGLISDGADGGPVRERNSIESVAHAFARGAVGCEVDVHYDTALDDFVVSHARDPYDLPGGELLTLAALLDAVGGRGHLWLDWKQLRHLDDAQLDRAVTRLAQLGGHDGLRSRLYVEGEAPFSLDVVAGAGVSTILDSHPTHDANLLTPLLADLYRALYALGDFTVLAMPSGMPDDPVYGPVLRRALRHVPLFLYHVPDDEAWLRELVDAPGVRALLLDDHAADRFDMLAADGSG